jgi:hypothetical protein
MAAETEFEWDDEPFSDTAPDSGQLPPPAEDIPGYQALFAAPDFASLLGRARTKTSRDYERKTQSILKAGVVGAFKRNNLPDAAALLQNGPAFARAVGDAADENERVRGIVDMITAPDSAMVALAITALALGSQLIRNHQDQAEQVAEQVKTSWKERREMKRRIARGEIIPEGRTTADKPKVTIKLPFGRTVSFGFRIRVPGIGGIIRGVLGSAVPPKNLVYSVFSDDKLIMELRKQGILIEQVAPDE